MGFKEKVKSVFTDGFNKNFLILLSGSLLGQLINVLVSPILTRIFTPAEFGYFGVFTSIVSILTGITTLKLEMALPLKENDKEYSQLFWTCLVINLLISVLIGVTFGLLPYSFYNQINIAEIYRYWWLIGVALFFTGTNRIFNSAVVRFKAFKEISVSFLNQVVIKNAFQIGFGLYYPYGSVLIGGTILNQITSLFNLARVVKRKNIVDNFDLDVISPKEIKSIFNRYKDYVVFGTPSGLANSLGLYLPVPLVMFFYGAEAAGSLSFGITLISIPMRVIGMSISQVFIGEAAEMIRNSEKGVARLYSRILKKLIQFSVIPALVVLFFGDKMFPLIFGEKWIEAGEFIQILTVCFALQFVSSPLSQILNLLVLQRIQLLWDVLRLILTVLTLTIPASFGLPVKTAIMFFSIGMSMSYVILIFLCKFYVRRREKTVINSVSSI
ncbi:oligosaccharide flippase family protein [Sphingobacterium shayense]|uniref:oligosaccharide flippase family protein n=1 Tax=Sphingobacterium shayense TaxID=626343 RepID=UPI0015523E23|nr:oligosaccharide flippase family protein [Sphingobacterium shayense]NQD70230.1 oligosaccharide flippase family protein [Sphingobacterium shayense]